MLGARYPIRPAASVNAIVGLVFVLALPAWCQPSNDPSAILAEAERLAWVKSWAKAEPLYAIAEKLFASQGDERNSLYARIGRIRGELPRRPLIEVSQELEDILALPIAKTEDRLRLRALAIKGETEEDFDPDMAQASWQEALEIANRIGDARWANRAKGELGLIAGLKGDVNAVIMQLGNAVQVAESNGDFPSAVRWMTIFGHGLIQFGRPEAAISAYDKALRTAENSSDMGVPVMTYLGKGEALAQLSRFAEAEKLLQHALSMATETGALGYQAEIKMKLGLIAGKQGRRDEAVALLTESTELAEQAGGYRLIAEAQLELARMYRTAEHLGDAVQCLEEGEEQARKLNDPLLLPKLLGEHADLLLAQGSAEEARDKLEEATDILESVLARTSSPWLKSRIFGVMDQVFTARLDLEGATGKSPQQLFAVIERARGRVLAEMLLARSDRPEARTSEQIAGERQLAKLQSKLYTAKSRATRRSLLDEIFLMETRMAPDATRQFHAEMATNARKAATLGDVQAVLAPGETLLEYAVTKRAVYCVEISAKTSRVHKLGSADQLGSLAKALASAITDNGNPDKPASELGSFLLKPLAAIPSRDRLIVAPDGPLHRIPFELLRFPGESSLLSQTVVSYTPSATVFALIRRRPVNRSLPNTLLAIASSPDADEPKLTSDAQVASIGQIARGVFDIGGTTLEALPAAADEARTVASLLGASSDDVLVGERATESSIKQMPLSDFRVLHFATHGLVSTRYPERSALLLRQSKDEDGLLQAREILRMNLRADLVTLSACDTGTGQTFGQEGVSNLVRPVLAAGARSVLASLWGSDDTFSLALMKAFYQSLAKGLDAGESLRRAKLTLLERFGPNATPRLWSGYLLYGDSTVALPTSKASVR